VDERKTYANVVTIFPPEKHEADDTVLLKLIWWGWRESIFRKLTVENGHLRTAGY
jgi:hypothetical protein